MKIEVERMVRPVKRRRVCNLPDQDTFGPVEGKHNEVVYMSIENYETIRLMDYVGLNQEQTANVMGVARSTVQRMYDESRKMIADSIVNGKMLKIQGGNYMICSEIEEGADHAVCHRKANCAKRASGKRCCEE